MNMTSKPKNNEISKTTEQETAPKKSAEKSVVNYYARNGKSIHLRTWNYFALFAVVLMVAVAVLYAGLSGPSYTFFKNYEIRSTIDNIEEYLNDIETNKGEITTLANESNAELFVFLINEDGVDTDNIVFSCNPLGSNAQSVSPAINEFKAEQIKKLYAEAISKEKSVIDQVTQNDVIFLTCLDIYTVNDSTYAVAATSSLSSQIGTRRIMLTQATLLFILALIMGLVYSWWLSKRLSNPIVNMSVSARKLAKGDYTVQFEGNGYNEVDELAEALNYATEQLSVTESMRKDIVANVSHDLKTPLTLIKSYAEMLKDFPDASIEKREERLDVIIKETDRITTLVNEMTELTLSESGNMKLNKEVFSLSELALSVVASFSTKAEKENCKLTADIQPDLCVHADKSQIEQVIYNYVSNAFNYTGDEKEIRIELKEKNGVLRFDCYDNGVGLSDQDKERIWNRYYRVSKTYGRNGNTGLGLSIVKSILIQHDAKYGVNSVLSQGSDFYFEIKRYVPDSALPPTEDI